MNEKLHTAIVPEPLLFDDPKQAQQPIELNLKLAYQLTSPNAVAAVNFALGEANGRPSLIFEIIVQTPKGRAPQSPDDLIAWVESAHGVVDKWFFALTRGSLLKEFEKTNQ